MVVELVVVELVVVELVVVELVVAVLAVAEPAVAEPAVAEPAVAVLVVVVLVVVVLVVVVRRYLRVLFPIPSGLDSNPVCWRCEREVPSCSNPSLAGVGVPLAEQVRGRRRCQRRAR